LRLGQDEYSLRTILGPPASWTFFRQHGLWLYPQYGAVLTVHNGLLAGFGVSFVPESYLFGREAMGPFRPFSGAIVTPNLDRTVEALDFGVAAVKAYLGTPSADEISDEEPVLIYDHDTWAMEFEFTRNGKLAHVEIYAIE
jgi:hypothetical protein